MAAPLVATFAHAAEVIWRFGHAASVNSPLHRHLLEAAEAIAKRSDGRMELRIIGEGQAGIQSGLLAQVRNGGMEMTVASASQLTPALAMAAIPSIGFLFDGPAKLWPAMDGELGQLVRTQIPTQIGVEVMDKAWDFGFRHITTGGHPIAAAADLAGLRIRTQIEADQIDMFRSLNAAPVVITMPYLRSALEHHQLDGQEGVLAIVEIARLNEVQSHCAMTHHAWDGFWLCVNPAAWKKLPERLQRIVSNTLNGVAARQREDTARQEAATRETLTKAGMRFTEVDKASFRDMLRRQGYYARIRDKFGEPAWNLIQKVSGVAA